jgi:hypothetical protein
MAGLAGVQGESSPAETDDTPDKAWSNGSRIYRINGLHNGCAKMEKLPRTMDTKRLKLSVMRVNGSQKITVKTPSLKTRGDSLSLLNNSPRTRRHSVRQEALDNSKRYIGTNYVQYIETWVRKFKRVTKYKHCETPIPPLHEM